MNNLTFDDVWDFCDKELKKIEEFEKEFRSEEDRCEYQQGMTVAYRKIQHLIRKKCSKNLI